MADLLPETLVGRGVLRPLQRDEKNDYANATGRRLILANVGQVLGTPVGSLRQRRAFGSMLHVLRHRPDHPSFEALAFYFAYQALGRWEPRARLRDIRRAPAAAPGQFRLAASVSLVLNETVIVTEEPIEFAVG
jgi:phage baseplate assembly protein W